MAELTTQERLQPALLDRLTDEEPEKSVESRDQRVMSLNALRRALLRDLSWLLNTTHLETTEDLSEYPEVARSVLNYGIPSFSGATRSTLDPISLERQVREAILRFEPRLIGKSLKVSMLGRNESDWHALQIQIAAELWAEPVPLRMFMKTELDLEIGAARVTEVAEGRR